MTLGSKNKKSVYWLIALGLVASYSVYTNLLSGPDVPASSSSHTAADTSAAPAIPTPGAASPAPRAPASRGRSDEFHPVYLSRRPEDRPDPTKIDPTLRADLLAKVQGVGLAGGSRNLFQFAPAPPKEPAKLAGTEPKVAVARPFIGPKLPPEPVKVTPPPPPPPPPITLKFYGFATAQNNGRKTAYFLDDTGDILMASEGDTLKRRYKIVQIKANSVMIEDLDAKRQQSVPIIEEGPSA
jgi:hypothetical protein